MRLWLKRLASNAPAFDYADTRQETRGPGGFLRPGFEGEVNDGLGGHVRWKTNAQGFRNDRDTSPDPAPGALRILSLGDSFTVGYRIDQGDTFSRLFEKRLEARGIPAEVLVADIEEPVNGLVFLQSRGLRFRPRIVLLGITIANDIGQVRLALDSHSPYRLEDGPDGPRVARGAPADLDALERFETAQLLPPESLLHPDAPPRAVTAPRRFLRLLELLLGPLPQPVVSASPRALLDSNGLGVVLKEPPAAIEEAYALLFRVLQGYRGLSAREGIQFAVLLFPQRYEVQTEDWQAMVEAYGLKADRFDPTLPARRIASFCRQAGIPCVTPADAMADAHRRSGKSLYLPLGDMHWNRAGHRAFFDAAAPALDALVEKALAASR